MDHLLQTTKCSSLKQCSGSLELAVVVCAFVGGASFK